MLYKTLGISLLMTCQAWFILANASIEHPKNIETKSIEATQEVPSIESYCNELSKKLRTVKYQGCLDLDLETTPHRSVKGRLLTQRHFKPADQFKHLPEGRILFISGIHGDEYSAISMTYLWMQNMLKNQDQTRQHWLFFPLANPDGLFRSPATRINANNIDLNRNFPSPDWDELAIDYWKKYYKKNKRRYPGKAANSEPETQWLVKTIEEFKPDAIISIHAPYGLLDYDGPDHSVPNKIGGLKHRELGTYPGSLGRYAGEYLKIPVLTLELRSAGSMPNQKEIFTMWQDVEKWTMTKIQGLDDHAVQQAYNQEKVIENGTVKN
ncbi:M14 family zinc carboxypeptidase [Thiomicrorhabdus sp. Kp2]|uniref:M14 family zinc carboxypeptidase n=1 Tax=Thiomicrorhabdus sp. Kp2 TaxID=1123518 RepID=UPI00068809CB|nr:M14 family zinc carboxypeptidase [Thiomicrorhabdus sp. Kp2]